MDALEHGIKIVGMVVALIAALCGIGGFALVIIKGFMTMGAMVKGQEVTNTMLSKLETKVDTNHTEHKQDINRLDQKVNQAITELAESRGAGKSHVSLVKGSGSLG